MYNIMIIGGEESHDYKCFEYWCAYYLQNKVKTDKVNILTTGDGFVDMFAKKFGIDTKMYPTLWNIDGKRALVKRNERIVSEANAMIYFNNGISDHDMIYRAALTAGVPIRVLNVNKLI